MDKKEFMNQKVSEMTIAELAEAIKLKHKGIYEKIIPGEKWEDITDDVVFKKYRQGSGYYNINLYYGEIQLGYGSSTPIGEGKGLYIFKGLREQYKVDVNKEGYFKILKEIS